MDYIFSVGWVVVKSYHTYFGYINGACSDQISSFFLPKSNKVEEIQINFIYFYFIVEDLFSMSLAKQETPTYPQKNFCWLS